MIRSTIQRSCTHERHADLQGRDYIMIGMMQILATIHDSLGALLARICDPDRRCIRFL
jgi:hypothetical protein